MNTKIIMTACALLLAAAGIICTFMPAETLHCLNLEAATPSRLLVQIAGALYFSFAMLNWMARASIIGGIYNRPVAVANFTHFFIAGLALTKGVMSEPGLPYAVWAIAAGYTVFAILFGIILFSHPVSPQ